MSDAAALPAKKNLGGRPTKYRVEYCERIVALSAEKGFSTTAFAGSIGVGTDLIYDWAARHPEFADAMKRAKAARAHFWESRLATLSAQQKVSGGAAALTIFALKNAVPAEFADRFDHRHRVAVEGRVEVVRVERIIVDPPPEPLEPIVIEGEVVEAAEQQPERIEGVDETPP